MATSPAFDFICAELEARTPLTQLEARGTVRIALKSAGLEASTVDAQMCVVLAKVLPAELDQRAVPRAAELCEELARDLSEQGLEEVRSPTPDSVFKRLGG